MEQHTFTEKQLLEIWEQIGYINQYIKQAYDPAFSRATLLKCHHPVILQALFAQGNWCLGQGFYYNNLCFINQTEGGDDWLAIKEDVAFTTINFEKMITQGKFLLYLEKIMATPKENCSRVD
jgi:hypothetical protein